MFTLIQLVERARKAVTVRIVEYCNGFFRNSAHISLKVFGPLLPLLELEGDVVKVDLGI